MSSPSSRRIVGSLALAAVTSTTALVAAPAQASPGSEQASSTVASASVAPGFPVADLSTAELEGVYHLLDTPMDMGGKYGSVEFFDPATGSWVGTRYFDGGGYFSTAHGMDTYRVVFQPPPGFLGTMTTTFRVVVDGTVYSAPATYTATVVAAPAPELTQVIPGTPTVQDEYGTAKDTYIVPNTEGVKYSANGVVVGAGLHEGAETVTITAEAQPGYKLTGTTEWTFEFTDVAPPAADPLPAAELTSSGPAGDWQHTPFTDLPGPLLTNDFSVSFKNPATGEWGDELVLPGTGYYYGGMNGGKYALFFLPEEVAPEGPAPTVTYRLSIDRVVYESTYTAHVGVPPQPEPEPQPAAPVFSVLPLKSSGDHAMPQLERAWLPGDTGAIKDVSVEFLDKNGEWTSELHVEGVGRYKGARFDQNLYEVSFVPDLGVPMGELAPVTYRLTVDGGSAQSTYTATVFGAPTTPTVPTEPQPEPQPEPQQVTAWSPTWWDTFGSHADTYEVPTAKGVHYFVNGVLTGPGTYPAKGTVRITAEAKEGHVLAEGPTSWTLQFSAGEIEDVRTSGPVTAPQSLHVDVPAGGDITLLDEKGHATDVYVVKGQGTYRLSEHGIEFTPLSTFYGKAQAVRYVVTDTEGNTAKAEYAATVIGKPKAGLSTADLTVNATQVSTVCTVTVVKAKKCTVTAYAWVDGKRTAVGSGKVTTKGTSHRVTVPVKLTRTGRALAARPQGLRLVLDAAVLGSDNKTHKFMTRTNVVAPKVSLRAIHFAADSAKLSKADRAYLVALRSQLGEVKKITITGFSDWRSTKAYNLRLGKARAEAVRKVLKGVKAPVVTASRGEANPFASNLTREGRAKNRRVEVQLHF